MKRKKKPGYYTLLTLMILFALGAVLTMMPISYAYKECMLGYKAHCTLAGQYDLVCRFRRDHLDGDEQIVHRGVIKEFRS